MQEEAKRIYERRRGFMNKAAFRLIWSALHPDSRRSITDKKLAEAFDAFAGMEATSGIEPEYTVLQLYLPRPSRYHSIVYRMILLAF